MRPWVARAFVAIGYLTIVSATSAAAQAAGAPEVVALWPEGVPRAMPNAGPEILEEGRLRNVHNPTLTVYPAPADRRTGTAVIICPGGAYRRLAIEHEGTATAQWLNGLGVSAFVLKYRLVEYGHPAPLQDVLRAVRLVRTYASRWNTDPGRIGVLGFSAGGHLASTAGVLFDAPEGRTGAELDGVSARPDFLVLIYPVIVTDGPYAHKGSVSSLLGKSPPADLIARLSTERQVTKDTPPTFLVHGGTDETVPPENSVLFYRALRKAGVPAEMHLYQTGPHGFGLQPDNGPISEWPTRCAEWLAARGMLPRPAGAPRLCP